MEKEMKFIKFDKNHVIEKFDGSLVLDTAGNAISVPFSSFFVMIMEDDKWGKSIKYLSIWSDIREKVKALTKDAHGNEKILILTDDEWLICNAVAEEPTIGYNVQLASACLAHANDLKHANSSLINLMESNQNTI